MKKCDCLLGYQDDWESITKIYRSTIEKEINDNLKSYHPLASCFNDFLDKRKSFIHWFRYCPNCGKKINLKEFKK